ncbi:MAG: HEAT repeat domain-containing protein [Candidatus Helarchaeota archaeon]
MNKEEIDEIAQGIWSTDQHVRLRTIHQLIKIKDPLVLSYLEEAYEDETEYHVKMQILEGLGKLAIEGVGAILLKALHEDDVGLRKAAINSIIKARDSSILNRVVLFQHSPESIPIEDEVAEAIRVLTIPRGDPTVVKPPDKERVYDYQEKELDYERHIKHFFED